MQQRPTRACNAQASAGVSRRRVARRSNRAMRLSLPLQAVVSSQLLLLLLLLASAPVRLVDGQAVEASALHTGAPAANDHLAAAAAGVPRPSPFFGYIGELWQPGGPLPDFSYAGGWNRG